MGKRALHSHERVVMREKERAYQRENIKRTEREKNGKAFDKISYT